MTTASAARGPLAGVRVVELAALGPAPFCAMLLADMGAEVLRIVPPHAVPAAFPVAELDDPIWRGRSRLVLDLKQPAARAQLLEILQHAEILIEGFRPGVMERLGLAPQDCLGVNRRLVFGRMTGWGQDGPLAQAPGHDPNYLALTGALHAIGYPGQPPCQPLNLVADFGGGALYLAVGVLAALLHARSTGAGQVVDAAMVDGATSLMSMAYTLFNHGHWRDERGANLLDGGAPYGRTYETADGKYVVVCALEPRFYAALIDALGLAGESLPAQLDRAGWPVLHERFAAIFRTRTRDDWEARLKDTQACVTPVLSLKEAPAHPHNRARGVFVGEPPMPAAAPRFSATPTAHAPRTERAAAELLAAWGLPAPAVAAMTHPGASP
ncbi:MAG TPA: CaiB/BaiF CoA-transferase family protein [Steroidobacteraceae bacterium]|nr:CaiB/BaiF CoA-transferase family protein [Steroidobacteraceae bacterium]